MKADVITQFSANTKVALLSQNGEWCKIRSLTSKLKGFMVCRLLGDEPLKIEVVGRKHLSHGKPNPAYSALRAFWIAPSLVRLQDAGKYFWGTMLNDVQRAKERPNMYSRTADGQPQFSWDTRPKPRRFPVPEFDAMKELMKQGVVAHAERRPAIIPWSDLNVEKPGTNTIKGRWFDTQHIRLMKIGRLAEIKPSYFKKPERLAPPSASVEQLSAQFGIRERLKITSGPQWVHFRHEDPYVRGYWDMGSTELSLEKPVFEYVIGRQGLAAASEWQAKELDDITQDYVCTEGFSVKPHAKKRLPGYPKIKDPLVWFFTPKALPNKKVAIKTFARRLNEDSKKNGLHRIGQSLLVMHEIDVNRDAVVDLSVWEIMGKPYLDFGGLEDTVVLRIIFVNIDGTWHFLDMETYGECT